MYLRIRWARLFGPLILRRTDPADTQSRIWRKSGCLYWTVLWCTSTEKPTSKSSSTTSKLNRMTVKIQITQHEKSRVKLCFFSGNNKPVIDISNTEKCKARLIESFQIDLLPCTFHNSYSKIRKRRRNLTANACTTNLFPKTSKGREDMGGEAGANYCQNVLYINLLEIVGRFSIRAWKCRLSRVTLCTDIHSYVDRLKIGKMK